MLKEPGRFESLALPELRGQLLQAALVARTHDQQRRSGIEAKLRIDGAHGKTNLLKFTGHAPGVFLAAVGDYTEVRAADLRPRLITGQGLGSCHQNGSKRSKLDHAWRDLRD